MQIAYAVLSQPDQLFEQPESMDFPPEIKPSAGHYGAMSNARPVLWKSLIPKHTDAKAHRLRPRQNGHILRVTWLKEK
jgi:hypothetical protein